MHPLILALASPLARQGVAMPFDGPGVRALSSIGNGVPLRIMPLGASITFGVQSSDGNGYRGSLRAQLVSAGNLVNMVGSRKHGQMVDNDVEGWPGYVIDQVLAKAKISVPQTKPNVILINAGTNDCLQNKSIPAATDRMEAMIDDLLTMSPRATVVLSSLIPNANANAEKNVVLVNEQFEALAKKMKKDGRPVVFADMRTDAGPVVGDLVDGTHPGNKGYVKMANIWYSALVEAGKEGLIQRAESVTGIPDDGGPTQGNATVGNSAAGNSSSGRTVAQVGDGGKRLRASLDLVSLSIVAGVLLGMFLFY